MLAIHGYYDGTSIQPLEKVDAKSNQKVIITFINEFIKTSDDSNAKGVRGILSEYANPALAEKEEGAWGQAMVNKTESCNCKE